MKEHNADRGVVLMRITAGWSIDRAILEPLRPPVRRGRRGSDTSTPWLGVFKRSDRPGYRVQTSGADERRGKRKRLGTFACDKEAAAVYNIWARNKFGMAAQVNLT